MLIVFMLTMMFMMPIQNDANYDVHNFYTSQAAAELGGEIAVAGRDGSFLQHARIRSRAYRCSHELVAELKPLSQLQPWLLL